MNNLSRRGLLKVGLFGSATLATAGLLGSLSGCSAEGPSSGFLMLRDSDLPMLRRVTDAVLQDAVPEANMPAAVQRTLQNLDQGLAHISPALYRQVSQLFDLLALPVTRGPLSGIWNDWEQADDKAVEAFLQRWENSSLALQRQGHAALLQMIQMAWYGCPESWEHCGYPGPPLLQESTDAPD